MFGGAQTSRATGSQIAEVALFNSSPTAQVIIVYGVTASLTNGAALAIYQETNTSNPGGAATLALWPPAGVGPGILIARLATNPNPPIYATLFADAAGSLYWPWDWPAGMLAPGSSMVFRAGPVAATLAISTIYMLGGLK